ncbi:MAG: TIGR04197 family type VII secretion effector [Oscillospiraceae bacterium]|nr:TIGR04197 family type VII secretion effector [Oscillospiraceae bacterium]
MSGGPGGNRIIATECESIEQITNALDATGANFQQRTLSPTDTLSTISANSNARNAFNQVQDGRVSFGDAISRSSSQINTIASTFRNIDSQSFGGGGGPSTHQSR